MRRRAFLGQAMASAAVVALASCGVEQTQKRTPRLGLVEGPPDSESVDRLREALRQGLRDHGYVDGDTVKIEFRFAKDSARDYDEFAAEFVAMPVDVILAPGTVAAQQAAIRATKAIPIVMTFNEDPVASGLVASLARPGGNVTGILNSLQALSAKRLELLRELAPHIKRVGAVSDGVTPSGRRSLKGAQDVARDVGVEIDDLVLRYEDDAELRRTELRRALDRATARGVDAILIGGVPFWISDMRNEIAAYALGRRIPLAGGQSYWADTGGLVVLGSDQEAQFRRLGYFVDRILKGARPGDIPIEQPSNFETIVNLRTAKALGLTVPQAVLARATRVIE
jgi:putative ABC transport system substrate-binding protein